MLQRFRCCIRNGKRLQDIPYRRIELCLGLHPFRLIHPPAANQGDVDDYDDITKSNVPRLLLSKMGLLFCIANCIIYLLAVLTIQLISPTGALVIRDDAVANVEASLLPLLRFVNVLAIFGQLFLGKRYECHKFYLLRRFERHLRALGADTSRAHRNSGNMMLLGLVPIVLGIASQVYVAVLFLERTVPPEDQEYLIIFSVAVVTPVMYIEMVIMQFCMRLVYLRIRVRQLNEIMEALLVYSRMSSGEDVDCREITYILDY